MEKTVESRIVYRGKIINLRLDNVVLDNGNSAVREIVEHPGAVGIIALKDNGEIVLVKQYRKAVEQVLLEIPAGKLEKGEDPKTCAARELSEETGYRAKTIKYLSSYYTSPGFSNEIMHMYVATGLEDGERNPDEDELVDTVEFSLERAVDMAIRGEIRDAKTVTGIMMLNRINDMT